VSEIVQTCFFAISGVFSREDAVARIKRAVEKTYKKPAARAASCALS
jgi:pyruvate-ferredoxin/flavodoxin oxidoreductase